VNRIVITVGVAYGSDTDKARNLLLDVAKKHSLIMGEPGPMATFEGFDDSTLRLVLRCYLPNLDNRLSVITELHTAIDQAYKEAGIEISFPQQDIHVRTSPPEWFKGPGFKPPTKEG
jgi:potassium efflux system protein